MATVTIYDRTFTVLPRSERGGLARLRKQLAAAAAAAEAKTLEEAATALVEHVASYLEPEPDLRAWLADSLPAEAGPLLKQLIEASGGTVADPGEAKGQ